jgi:hypothetical protein
MKRTEWYKVIEASTAKELEEMVNGFISDNGEAWQPTGGVYVGRNGMDVYFTQALRFAR